MKQFIHSISCAAALLALAAQSAFAGDGFSKDSAVVMNNILTRTSIRKFEQRPVEQSKVLALLRAGMAAPTARDRRRGIINAKRQTFGDETGEYSLFHELFR